MKKFLTLILTLLVLLTVVACSSTSKEPGYSKRVKKNELYLITDVGTIDDKSFNQGAWEGLVKFATEEDAKAEFIKPTEQSDAAYLAAIDQAVKAGAKIVVTPGFLFEPSVYEAQTKYPEVNFILVDGVPHTADYKTYKTEKNTVGILFREEQSGFFAGYAAVKEGFTKLGFMGGMAVPAVIRFGYGFVAGADYAAQEMGVKVEMNYKYLGDFEQKPEHTVEANAWFASGTELIHAAAGGAGNMVMKAAEESKKWMIGVDVDQKAESESVLTSAMKNLQKAVYDAAKASYDGKFPGGETWNLGVNEDGVQISSDFSRFKNFKQADYDALYKKLRENTDNMASNIPTDASAKEITELTFKNVTVNLK